MNVEELRSKDWIVYEVISGSHAYGTNIEGSDTDIRGVFVLPTEEVLAGRYIEQISDETNDVTFYEIGRFIELLAKGNPNMQELLAVDDEYIIHQSEEFIKYFPQKVKDKFITKRLKHTYTGYAYTQIKKAKGLNKKINYDKNKVERKDVLDFCYVILEREESCKFKHWIDKYTDPLKERLFGFAKNAVFITSKVIGLAKVNNVTDLYSMYYMPDGGGIIGDDSNTVQLRSIPKGNIFIGYLKFDMNAYSTHCKDYREYTEWIEKRNPQRYADNLKGEQGYDHKNMLHCVRLLNMAKDIANGKGIVVKRPEREYLLDIRNGKIKYDKLLSNAEELVQEIKDSFDKVDLPDEVDMKMMQELLLTIRKDFY